jgi:hypothetical protein
MASCLPTPAQRRAQLADWQARLARLASLPDCDHPELDAVCDRMSTIRLMLADLRPQLHLLSSQDRDELQATLHAHAEEQIYRLEQILISLHGGGAMPEAPAPLPRQARQPH